MKPSRHISALLAASSLAAFVVCASACTMGSPSFETIEMPVHAQPGANVCGSAFVTPDLSTLRPCGDGAGHCYAGNKVAIPNLPACATAGDVCVPDSVLKAGGKKALSCTFYINGKPGACTSILISDIAAHKDQLRQEGCQPDERCAPCIDPRDNVSETHLCDPIGVHGDACEAGAAQQAPTPCCHYAGVCLSKEAVPEGSRADMNRDSCTGDNLCAPAALANGMPEKCDVLGASGVCIDLCFATMLKGTGVALRSGCGPTEVCMPCAIGKDKGMPGCD
jgi:hypothetical protein